MDLELRGFDSIYEGADGKKTEQQVFTLQILETNISPLNMKDC